VGEANGVGGRWTTDSELWGPENYVGYPRTDLIVDH
jgi:hypothetical protein